MSRAALVILNPVSGRGRAHRVWRRYRRILEVPFPHLVVHETTGPGDGNARAAAWVAAGERGPILIVGGDGTVHEVVNAVTGPGGGVSIGVLPAGTGNDFARNTGIPLDPGFAAERIDPESGKPLDLGRLAFVSPDGTERRVVFVNSVSVGVSPAANRYSQWLGYVAGGIVALLTQPRRAFRVSAGNQLLHDGKALNITLANGAGFGGGMRISPASSPWDGVLDRVIIGRVGLPRALLAFARLRRGRHLGMRGVASEKAVGETAIESEGTFHVEADGHDFVAKGRIVVSVEPGALRVLGIRD